MRRGILSANAETSHPADRLTVQAGPAPPWPDLLPRWAALEARARPPVFLSAMWIGAWLQATGARPLLLEAVRGARTAGLALLCRASGGVRRLWRDSWHLHQTGDPAIDALYVEHNGALAAPGEAAAVARAFALHLRSTSGRPARLVGPGLSAAALAGFGFRPESAGVRAAPAYVVDLNGVASEEAYLATLSANRRQQIRRAQRALGAPVEAVRAWTVPDALKALAQLRAWHQDWWRSKGKPGAFANPAMPAFAEALIRDGLETRQADVLTIRAGDRAFGVLLALSDSHAVRSYLSGFDYGRDPRSQPGLLSHVAAIAFYAREGRPAYDLLAGDSRYKASLAKARIPLFWVDAPMSRAGG